MDKHRHALHVEAHQQQKKDNSESEKKEKHEETDSISLWKQYRSTTDHRKGRKSINRGRSRDGDMDGSFLNSTKAESEVTDAMDVDQPEIEVGEKTGGTVEDSEKKTNVPSAETDPFEEVKKLPSADLLSDRELHLCQLSNLKPVEYLEIKRMIVQQSISAGLVENRRRTLLQIDVERRGEIIDFMVKAGWVSPKVEAEVRSLN